jgi:hypothetical protein
MTEAHRSGCPVNLPLEVFGDKWSLLILRDMVLPGPAAAIRCAINGLVWRAGAATPRLSSLSSLQQRGTSCRYGGGGRPSKKLCGMDS